MPIRFKSAAIAVAPGCLPTQGARNHADLADGIRAIHDRPGLNGRQRRASIWLRGRTMATIPQALHEHINTAYPQFVCLVGAVLPNGYAQITPRGSTMVFDDE